ncbi:MAG: PHP domain-containing protein, partial [archaeon]|nr:PHP domain-containing protein [archaeon]
MKIINEKISGDYHIHSSTLSDGMNSIDEIVIQAGKLNYKEIAITDHN